MSEPFEHPTYRSREEEISQTPIYAAVKRYTRHIGPETHAILGNLKWAFFSEDQQFRASFVSSKSELIEAFNWYKSPQGHDYWFRVQRIMDEGKRLRNQQRIEKLKQTLASKAAKKG